jgi:peptide chain release factor subunit 1
MMEVSEVFGLLVMDRKEAAIGILEGKRIEILQKMTSGVPSKVRAGGQSSQRFHRITEGLTKEFYKRIAEEMKKIFFDMPKLKGILVGGPIPTKDEFLDGEYLVTKLREKVIGRIDIGDSDESGLKELVEKSRDILADQEIVHEKKILEKFFETLGEKPGMVFYKEDDIRKALQYGAVETLIISKEFDKKTAKELIRLAKNIGSNIETVSTETTEGEQFKNLSGIGAILRFKV